MNQQTDNPVTRFKNHTALKPVAPIGPVMPCEGAPSQAFRDYADNVDRYHSDVNSLHIRMGYWEDGNRKAYEAARLHITGCYYSASGNGKEAQEYLFDWCYKNNGNDIDAAMGQYYTLVAVVRDFNDILTTGNRRGR